MARKRKNIQQYLKRSAEKNQDINSLINEAKTQRWKVLDLASPTRAFPPQGTIQVTEEDWRTIEIDKLVTIPPSIGELSHLEELFVNSNELRTLPPEIGLLTELRVLDLTDNKLSVLPEELGNLSKLESLNLSRNLLVSLPSRIGGLSRLKKLDVRANKLATVPAEIGDLLALVELFLHENDIDCIPEEIGKLSNLITLSLNNNHLDTIPESIGNLTSLAYLYLQNNYITDLPVEIGNLENLLLLNVNKNPLVSPPPEIVDGGTTAIVTYLRQRGTLSRRQWFSKLIVIGEGGVGKTSLVKALLNQPFNETQASTHGVEIFEINLTHPLEKTIDMHLKTWDFGGQEIYHATHQFFLTNRSLFLLVWNARHGWEQGKLRRWLDVIKARAPESPVIIVATHIDEREAICPFQELQQAYPQIAAYCAVSNKSREGIDALRETVRKVASDLPLMGESWPATWLEAADAIRTYPEPYATPRVFEKLMLEQRVTGGDATVLTRWLHELGDILYFQPDNQLNNIVILKPQWVTKHISSVLESEEVISHLGIFSSDHMDDLWSDLPYDLRVHFLWLMERFDLSYRIPENLDISLVVECLPLDPPPYQDAWESILRRRSCQEITMVFRLNTIPPGVPTWFIARQHRFTTYTHWRNGALFAQDSRDPYTAQHLAMIVASGHERMVTLTVRGAFPQNFFALLKDGLEVTLARFPGLVVNRFMPCPTHGCTHLFDYGDLQRRLLKKPLIECPKCWEEIPVPQLLFGIEWQTQDAVLERLDVLEAAFEGGQKKLQDKILYGQQQILIEQQELKQLTQREFLAAFKREQRLIESHCPNVFLFYSTQPEWYKKPFTKQKMDLHLCCQAPNEWHYTYQGYERTGCYEVEFPADWLVTLAPYLKLLFRLVQIAVPFFHDSFGVSRADIEQEWDHHISLMHDLIHHLPNLDQENFGEAEGFEHLTDDSLRGPRFKAYGATLRQIRALLDEQDPTQEWGGLRKTLTPEGHYLWLCEYHAVQYEI